MPTSDDSVREIQLSGKQLVFLFMAVTVVSVVIFLCGVLVGRGVQAGPAAVAAAATTPPIEEPADPTAPGAPAPAAPPADPTAVPNLGFQTRLESETPVPETLAKPGDPPAAPAPTKTAPRSTPETQTPAAPTTTTTPAPAAARPATPNPAFVEPRGDGFAIQVAALSGRVEAEAVAARLKAKGYTAFVLTSLPGQPSGFKVRVGKFKARAEAEKVATKLEREEQFKPWITR
jgi:DedD protein